MGYQSDRINTELRGTADKGESMDVLLQLTLPIILILAFVVVTEIQSLNEDVEASAEANAALRRENQDLQEEMALLNKELQGTETGRLKDELDLAILTLQHQLLLQAADAIARAEYERIRLAAYPDSTPTVEDLLDGRIADDFATISAALANLYNGPGHFEQTESRLRAGVIEYFQTLADEVFPPGQVSNFRRNKLKNIATENRASFQAKLAGHLRTMEQEASAVQLEVVVAWIASKQADAAVKDGSSSIWRTILAGGDETVVRATIKDFVNLKALVLIRRLETLAVPVLDETCRVALDQSCSELL